jgi:carbon monoxide dehydrogenase subunit G
VVEVLRPDGSNPAREGPVKIEDSFTIAAPLDRVWSVIRDPNKVAGCIPGCRSVEAIDDTHYRAVVQVALGPIKTTFNLLVEVLEERAPVFAATMTKGEENGRASSVSARNELRLERVDANATVVKYASDVTVVGRLGNYGLGLMKKRAQSMGQDFARSLQGRLDDEGGAVGLRESGHQRDALL